MTNEQDRVKRAATMLLNGATLVSQPCPYCKGVRIIKDGNALCVSCGQEPEERHIPQEYDHHASNKDVTKKRAKTEHTHHHQQQQQQLQNNNTEINHNDSNESKVDIVEALKSELATLAKELTVETDKQKKAEILNSVNKVLTILEKARNDLEKDNAQTC